MKRNLPSFTAGLICGALLFGGTAAYAAGVIATLSTQPIYANGQRVHMTAYNINGNNYVRLRDIGEQVGFNVYWKDGVQIDSDAAYTGVAPAAPAKPEEPVEKTESTLQDTAAIRQEIVAMTNAIRTEQGLSTLSVNDKLMQAAQVRAEEMAANTAYSHTRPDGTKYVTVTDCPYVAENINCIASLYLTQQNKKLAQATMESWGKSAGHLDNILNTKASSIGVGIAEGVNDAGLDCWYCVQLFLYDGYTVTAVNELTTK